jgi:hypothetical protein
MKLLISLNFVSHASRNDIFCREYSIHCFSIHNDPDQLNSQVRILMGLVVQKKLPPC